MVDHGEVELAESPLIAQALGERCGRPEILEAPPEFSKHQEHTAQVNTEVECLGERVALLGEMLRGDQRLLKGYRRFPIGRAPLGLASRLPAVEEGLVPDLAPEGMGGQAVDMVG